MARLRKSVLCYTLGVRRERGYSKLYLRIFEAKEQSVELLGAGTVQDRAGYGSPEAAAKMGRWYLSLYEQGHRILLEINRYGKIPDITIRWQEYIPDLGSDHTPGYCQAHFDSLGDGNYADIQSSTRFLKKLAKKIVKLKGQEPLAYRLTQAFRDPAEVIEALEALKAKRVNVWPGQGEHHYQLARTYDLQPRMWLLTETLWKIFEVT